VRGELGLMLFSGDAAEKRVSALSGGEAARLVFARLSVEQPNVLVLDEPTNHLDLESIEALVAGLVNYEGTLVLVSHDRWFVSQLATRVVEIRRDGIRDYHGTYDEYVHACGDDHLDADTVLKAQRSGKKRRDQNGQREPVAARAARAPREAAAGQRAGEQRLTEITARIETCEARVAEIDATFATPGFFEGTPAAEVRALQGERGDLQAEIERLMAEWERLASTSEALA
jgi:energy-coupling factor transporter ATP-binding protein EcfA2